MCVPISPIQRDDIDVVNIAVGRWLYASILHHCNVAKNEWFGLFVFFKMLYLPSEVMKWYVSPCIPTQTPEEDTSGHLQSQGGQPTLLMSDLGICKHREEHGHT